MISSHRLIKSFDNQSFRKMKLTQFILLALPFLAFSQTEKGVRPVNQPTNQPINQTHAVVVGISDYQSPDIPDLHFADRDATEFANWLKFPAGGSVPPENIQFLTNQNATFAAFAAALDWLVEVCKEGEQAVIFFSGHGDVETKTVNQLGFLLEYDTPARCYKAGAYPLTYLVDIVSTLSIKNGVRVTVVTDACHAGKLAGTSVNGTQATAQNLAKQFAGEVKIMSCQPNEFSLEGEQWGGGRGVFSLHLLEGMTGLADKNADGTVSLFEIGRYLEDVVPAAAAPQSQLPMTVGDRAVPVARVDAAALADLQTKKAGEKPKLAVIGSKGFEQSLLHDADSLSQKLYAEFKVALQNHELLDAPYPATYPDFAKSGHTPGPAPYPDFAKSGHTPGHRSADALFRQFAQNPSPELAPLQNLMRRNLAVALQDEVQQALNALLDNDPYEANNWAVNPQRYSQFPAYLVRTIELLGEGHYMAKSLRAKQIFFEGHNLSRLVGELENEPARRDSFKNEAKTLLLRAFALDPEAAYVPFAIGSLSQYNPYQSDSLVLWCSRANALAPTWLTPYLAVAEEMQNCQADAKAAEHWVLQALAQDSTSYIALEKLSHLRQWQFRPLESIAISDKMIALKPDLFNAWSTKGMTLHMMLGEFEESEKCCLRSLELNPNGYAWAGFVLALDYVATRRPEKAVEFCRNALKKPISEIEKGRLHHPLVEALIQLSRYEEAQGAIREVEIRNV